MFDFDDFADVSTGFNQAVAGFAQVATLAIAANALASTGENKKARPAHKPQALTPRMF